MKLGFRSPALSALSLVVIAVLSSCSSDSGDGGGATPVGAPVIKKVSQDNYLSGRKFCETYSDVTSKENGIWVTVPRSYENPKAGTLTIYAYTLRPFDPSKPSYIFVDGGPGQNTHGVMPEYFGGEMNEIRFDQRGLGCSAPETWEVYKDARLYSSQNTIRDMDVIRKTYKIQKWSVYGVSYGTVPATMYGSAFPDNTTSVVLEGVVGAGDLLHKWSWKVEKLNLMLAQLTPAQKEAFIDALNSGNTPEAKVYWFLFNDTFYRDGGFRFYLSFLKTTIDPDGNLDRDRLKLIADRISKRDSRYQYPQQPGAVDENILTIIYCRELNYREKDKTDLYYSKALGFFEQETPSGDRENAARCDKAGVSLADEHKYDIHEHRVSAPIYYFQGSHDGATTAKGAIEHWKTVPKGKSYFLLAQKGGHNPNLSRLEMPNSQDEPDVQAKMANLRFAEINLFRKSMNAIEITADDIELTNKNSNPGQNWLLFMEPAAAVKLEPELEGIKKRQAL